VKRDASQESHRSVAAQRRLRRLSIGGGRIQKGPCKKEKGKVGLSKTCAKRKKIKPYLGIENSRDNPLFTKNKDQKIGRVPFSGESKRGK